MYRRTMPGETAGSATGTSNSIHFNAKVYDKGTIITPSAAGPPDTFYYIDVDTTASGAGTSLVAGEEFMAQIGNWKIDNNWYINQVNAHQLAIKTQKRLKCWFS